MPVEDVFGIKGRGTVVTGRIERGIVKVGDEVELVGVKPTRKIVVTGVEMFKKLLDEGRAGDNVGCLIRGIEREEIERGQVLAKPGSIKPHTKFTAQVYVLTKEEGGRHTPFFNGYRPQFYLRTTDVTGAIGLPDGVEMVMPGDNVEMSVELITPMAIEDGLRFAIREGGRTVGAGAIVTHRRVGTTWRSSGSGSASRPTTTDCWTSRRRRSSRPPSAPARTCVGPVPLPDAHREVHRPALAVHRQGLPGAVRDPHPQAARRHPGSELEDRRRPDATHARRRRRHRDQDVMTDQPMAAHVACDASLTHFECVLGARLRRMDRQRA